MSFPSSKPCAPDCDKLPFDNVNRAYSTASGTAAQQTSISAEAQRNMLTKVSACIQQSKERSLSVCQATKRELGADVFACLVSCTTAKAVEASITAAIEFAFSLEFHQWEAACYTEMSHAVDQRSQALSGTISSSSSYMESSLAPGLKAATSATDADFMLQQKRVEEITKQSTLTAEVLTKLKTAVYQALRAQLVSRSQSQNVCNLTGAQLLAKFEEIFAACWTKFQSSATVSEMKSRLMQVSQELQECFQLSVNTQSVQHDAQHHHKESGSTTRFGASGAESCLQMASSAIGKVAPGQTVLGSAATIPKKI